MSRPPTPTNLRILRGNPSKRPIKPEPQPVAAAEVPPSPEFLTGYAVEEWNRVALELHRLGLLTLVDTPALAVYCYSYGKWCRATEIQAELAESDPVGRGLTVTTDKGVTVQHPIVAAIRGFARDMAKFAGEFGMSPASRARIGSAGYTPPPDGGKFAGLLRA